LFSKSSTISMLMYRETEQHIKDKVNTMFYKAP